EDTLAGVELGGETAGVPHRVARAATADDSGESGEDRCLLLTGEKVGAGDLPGRAVGTEDAMGAGTSSMHHSFRDALVVEVHDLLAQVVVLQQRRPSRTGLQGVVGVSQREALRRGEPSARLGSRLRLGARPPGRRDWLRRRLVFFGRRRFTWFGRLRRRRHSSRSARDVYPLLLLVRTVPLVGAHVPRLPAGRQSMHHCCPKSPGRWCGGDQLARSSEEIRCRSLARIWLSSRETCIWLTP